MADIFDEINEDMKRDRAQQVWARYGKYVVGTALAVIAVVGGIQGFDSWKRSQAQAAATLYYQSLAAEDAPAALSDVMSDLTSGYALMGRFQLAAGLAAGGDLGGAEAAYDALAADTSIAPLYQQAALLMAVMNAPEGSDAGALQDKLAPLVDADGPWQPLALELSVALDLQSGNKVAALTKLEVLEKLETAPNELRQRAARLSGVLNS